MTPRVRPHSILPFFPPRAAAQGRPATIFRVCCERAHSLLGAGKSALYIGRKWHFAFDNQTKVWYNPARSPQPMWVVQPYSTSGRSTARVRNHSVCFGKEALALCRRVVHGRVTCTALGLSPSPAFAIRAPCDVRLPPDCEAPKSPRETRAICLAASVRPHDTSPRQCSGSAQQDVLAAWLVWP